MKKKIANKFCYEGLGFPVIIDRVEMIPIEGEFHPKIDVQKLSDQVIRSLSHQKERITGHQLKFIRTYFSMSLRQFAKTVAHETHAAVAKWEKFGDNATQMNQNTECLIKLYVIEQLETKTKKEKNAFFDKYKEINQLLSDCKPRVFVHAYL